jgi:hypothetical protein
MAEGQPPHWDLDPMEAIFVIPKSPPPKLKEENKWSNDFKHFLEVKLFFKLFFYFIFFYTFKNSKNSFV